MLLPEPAVQIFAVGAGDGDRRGADMGAVLADLVDLVEGYGKERWTRQNFSAGRRAVKSVRD